MEIRKLAFDIREISRELKKHVAPGVSKRDLELIMEALELLEYTWRMLYRLDGATYRHDYSQAELSLITARDSVLCARKALEHTKSFGQSL